MNVNISKVTFKRGVVFVWQTVQNPKIFSYIESHSRKSNKFSYLTFQCLAFLIDGRLHQLSKQRYKRPKNTASLRFFFFKLRDQDKYQVGRFSLNTQVFSIGRR